MNNKIGKIFSFGEKKEEYSIKVLNEREIRAGAGILFFFAIISFMNVWLIGNFNIMKVFVIIFSIDFFIRIFINPKFAPSLILGKIITNNQEPEYTGAPQKRFAWSLGLILSTIMSILIFITHTTTPLNLLICIICLMLLFLESSFGICLGCNTYNLFNKRKAKLCPGNSCKIKKKEKIQKINFIQIIIVILVLIGIILLTNNIINSNKITTNNKERTANTYENNLNSQSTNEMINNTTNYFSNNNKNNADCEVPQWAIDIGHEELYKLHHGCD